MAKKLKVALVYDWLTNMGGAERLLLTMHKAFPDAPIYTSVYNPQACAQFKNSDVRTTWLQRLPTFLRYRHQFFPVLRAYAFRKLDLTEFDIIISSSSAEAKAVRKRADALHICYCHTPTRYYWSHYKDYIKDPGFGALNPLIRLIIPPFVGWMRKLDLRAAGGVDYFIANSHAVAARIKKYYKRDAAVINPAIDMQLFRKLNVNGPRQGFVMLGRQVAYKRYDLGVQACSELNTPLTVIGNGPEHDKLLAMAGPSVHFRQADDAQKVQALAGAEAFLFPQEEDFGMVQLEAMAAGTPVIAYKKGGALDVVQDGKTGIFFETQTSASLKSAVKRFRKQRFNHAAIRTHAEAFSEEHFIKALREFVSRHS